MSLNKYLLVFDTNVLCVPHEKKGDFTKFYFNSTFKNLLDKIEELDIYQNVGIAIPAVVWQEMKEQKIKAYEDKLEQVRKNVSKFVFPFCEWTEVESENKYEEYLQEQIASYREKLDARQITIIELDIPTSSRYENIVQRAFQKRPPFEGKETQSDKGFKDALLLESILEYREQNLDVDIFLYTNDKLFNNELEEEYSVLFEGSHIRIFQNNEEAEIVKELEVIAKNVDEFVYIPPEYDENQDLNEWLESDDFKKQVLEYDDIFNVVNKYIAFSDIKVIAIYEIKTIVSEDDLITERRIFLKAEVEFKVQGVQPIKDLYDMTVYVSVIDDMVWNIEDIQLEEGEDDE